MSDRIPLQVAILRVAPCSLESFALLRSDGKRLQAELVADGAVDQNVALTLVGHQAVELRIEEDRVADGVAAEMRIEVCVESHGTFALLQIAQIDAANEQIAIEVHRVADRHLQIERRRTRGHPRHQAVIVVVELLLPGRTADPGELPTFHHVDDRLKIISNLRDRHSAKSVIDPELENEDVDPGFEMRGQALQSAVRRSAALARICDFEIGQTGGAQFFGQQRRIRLSRAQPEARRQTVTENKNSFHCRRIARRGGNGWRG